MNMFWRVLVLHLNLLRTFRSVSETVARFLNLNPFLLEDCELEDENRKSDETNENLKKDETRETPHTDMTTLTRHDATTLHAKT